MINKQITQVTHDGHDAQPGVISLKPCQPISVDEVSQIITVMRLIPYLGKSSV